MLLIDTYKYDALVLIILALVFYNFVFEISPFFNFNSLNDTTTINGIGYLLLRCISFVYIIAMYSLYYQILGLIGCNGLTPLHLSIRKWNMESKLNQISYMMLYNASINDNELKKQVLISLIVAFVSLIYPHPICYLYLYLFYNAVKKGCTVFLQLQWDSLLLEVLFLSIFFSIAVVILQNQICIIIFNNLIKLTLFRLMFGSGIVKFMSSDQSWNNLTALTYHFLTQPLPNPIANKIHFFPVAYLKVMTFLTIVVEILIPVISLIPLYSIGVYTCIIYLLLQISIILFGHFGFFNLLSCILGISLLLISDNEIKKTDTIFTFTDTITLGIVLILMVIAGFIFLVNISALLYLFTRYNCLKGLRKLDMLITYLFKMHKFASTFHVGNHYGLFANMTKYRDEIIIEVCYDDEGIVWYNIPFLYKPFCENLNPLKMIIYPIFHMPRLDWRLWFISLSKHHIYTNSNSVINFSKAVVLFPEWFYKLLHGILDNNISIQSLLGEIDHKINKPMKFIRVKLASFNFNPNFNNENNYWLVNNERIIVPKVTLNELSKLCSSHLSEPINLTKMNKPKIETKEELIMRTLFNKK